MSRFMWSAQIWPNTGGFGQNAGAGGMPKFSWCETLNYPLLSQ